MNLFLIFISTIFFIILFKKIRIEEYVKDLSKTILKIFTVIPSSKISDHWKEKVLLRYSFELFFQSVRLFFTILVALSPFITFCLFSIYNDKTFINLAFSPTGLLTVTIFAIISAFFFPNKKEKNYNSGSRILHHIVLNNNYIGETLFDIETLLFSSKRIDISEQRHVFVAGLARAGTTILMRILYGNGHFCSLTYRDMPFVLSPNLWNLFSRLSRHKAQAKKRAHGDGLSIDFDSPEALEEIFWRTFCGREYIKQSSLTPMTADDEIIYKFRKFVHIISKKNKQTLYLSKNNNNVLRLSSILKAFPNAIILVPFRDPIQQSYSLLNQHNRFLQLQSRDDFIRKYMTWLVHHEFGADHRPFSFSSELINKTYIHQLRYWLSIWINTYSFLININSPQVQFLSYESLCDDTEYVLNKLSSKVGLHLHSNSITLSKSVTQVNEYLPEDMVSNSKILYSKLVARSLGYQKTDFV